MACSEELRRQGQPCPRTCEDCGLGPCKNYPKEGAFALHPKADPSRSVDLETKILWIRSAYHIEFETLDMPGKLVATKIVISKDIISDLDRRVAVDLSSHPLYRKLEAYVLANPSKRRN